jgi:hypothetical protein
VGMSYDSRPIRILFALMAMLLLLTLACFASSALQPDGAVQSSRTQSKMRAVSGVDSPVPIGRHSPERQRKENHR